MYSRNRVTETHVQKKKKKKQSYINTIIIKLIAQSSQLSEFNQIKLPYFIYHQYQKNSLF